MFEAPGRLWSGCQDVCRSAGGCLYRNTKLLCPWLSGSTAHRPTEEATIVASTLHPPPGTNEHICKNAVWPLKLNTGAPQGFVLGPLLFMDNCLDHHNSITLQPHHSFILLPWWSSLYWFWEVLEIMIYYSYGASYSTLCCSLWKGRWVKDNVALTLAPMTMKNLKY